MELNSAVSGVTSNLVLRALDASALRHYALASNIANASNEAYPALRVNFEEQLGLLREQLLQRTDEATARRALGTVQPRIEPEPNNGVPGTYRKIQLDAEIAKMMQNTVYYQALLAAHGKNGSIVRMAIKEGRI